MCKEKIVKMFLNNSDITITEIAEEIGITKKAVQKVLVDLPEYKKKQENKEQTLIKRNDLIKELYIHKNMSTKDIIKSEIGMKYKLTTKIVYKVLSQISEYKNSQLDRKESSLSKQNEILELFFDKKKKTKEISVIMDVTEAFITKVIKSDKRYENEKNQRKETARLVKQSNSTYDKEVWAGMKKLQEQNAIEMSRSSKISDEALVFMCKSAYDSVYDGKKNELVYNYKCGQPTFKMPLTFSLKAQN